MIISEWNTIFYNRIPDADPTSSTTPALYLIPVAIEDSRYQGGLHPVADTLFSPRRSSEENHPDHGSQTIDLAVTVFATGHFQSLPGLRRDGNSLPSLMTASQPDR